MSTHVGIGFSLDASGTIAARDAALQARTSIPNQQADLVIVFSTPHYQHEDVLKRVRQTISRPKAIGCSTGAIIFNDRILSQGIGVLAIQSQEVKFGIGYVSNFSSSQSRMAGADLARSTITDFGDGRRNAFIIFSDGLMPGTSSIISGVQEVFGKIFPVIGAKSSDKMQFQKTYQFFQDQSMTSSATAVLLGGQSQIGFGCRHGWKPLGKPRIVTQSQGNIIKTIDSKPACLLYEEYLGLSFEDMHSQETLRVISSYPLGISMEEEQEYLLRTVSGIHDDGSIVCQGDVPPGAEIHLMITNKDFLKQAAHAAAHEVKDTLLGRPPKLIMVFQSLNRHRILGRDILNETQVIHEILGTHIPMIGMCSFGEIAPLKSSGLIGQVFVHNGTMAILAIA